MAGGTGGTLRETHETDYRLSAGEVPVAEPCDVVGCGGGPSGVGAALAAARNGLKTLVVEGQGQLGGMGTSGLVSHWLGGRTNGCRHWVVGGIFRELATEGAERGIALLPRPHPGKGYSPFGWNAERGGQLTAGVPFDPFAMSGLLDEKMAAAGVTLLYLTRVVDVMQEGGRITHLVLHNKSGFSAVPPTLVVDATGDADVAVLSGCETVIGRRQDRLMPPVTLQVHMDGIEGIPRTGAWLDAGRRQRPEPSPAASLLAQPRLLVRSPVGCAADAPIRHGIAH